MSSLARIANPEQNRCLVCGDRGVPVIADCGEAIVQCTELWPTRESARSAQRARIELVGCDHCGAVTNARFDSLRVGYDTNYENSQHFSPRFRAYAEQLAARLVADYGIRNGHVIELGSGKGEFLTLLCAVGENHGTGYDPTYDGESDAAGARIVFVKEPFGPRTATEPADLICCRHVFEHLDGPLGFLRKIRETIGDRRPTVLYLEVPNGDFVLSDSGLWDIIYQHCSYFSAAALRWVVEAAGFNVVRCDTAFDDQFLFVEAVPRPHGSRDGTTPNQGSLANASTRAFSARYRRVVEGWRHRLDGWAAEGQHVALWGAGSKGVRFLDTVGGDRIRTVIDVNPRKCGSFLPGSAHLVSAPESLVETPPDRVIVINAGYADEIRQRLRKLGLRSEVHTV